jgi:hypothetical protein
MKIKVTENNFKSAPSAKSAREKNKKAVPTEQLLNLFQKEWVP